MKDKPFSIAIDGPSGAGKSSAAKAVARELNAMYLDTGAMYRAVGVYMMQNGISLDDGEAIEENVSGADIQVRFENGVQKMYLAGEDISEAIRTPEASTAASKVSAVPGVRERMVQLQRSIAAGHSVVMDGRDIGTHVLPDAPLKIFLTASSQERARRRWLELQEKGANQSYEDVLADIRERDARDCARAASPLRKAGDAVELDCSRMDLPAVTREILRLARERMA